MEIGLSRTFSFLFRPPHTSCRQGLNFVPSRIWGSVAAHYRNPENYGFDTNCGHFGLFYIEPRTMPIGVEVMLIPQIECYYSSQKYRKLLIDSVHISFTCLHSKDFSYIPPSPSVFLLDTSNVFQLKLLYEFKNKGTRIHTFWFGAF